MKTRLLIVSSLLVLSLVAPASAKHHKATDPSQSDTAHELPAHPDTYDETIAKQAKLHGIPESLIHRIIVRESRYRAEAMNRIYYGLMQITYATARAMGYQGTPQGLLDPKTNLAYGVPYLANAYIVAENDPDRAVALYAHGYYFEAKRKHKLAMLRTATSAPVIEPEVTQVAQTAPEPPANPVAQLFQALAGPAPAPQQTADASAEMEPVEVDVPLPPRRPRL